MRRHFKTSATDTFGALLSTGQVTLTSTAGQIVGSRKTRDGVMFIKHGSRDTYLGCSNVSTTNGMLFAGTCSAYIILPTTDSVYGVVATGEEVVSYIEIFPG